MVNRIISLPSFSEAKESVSGNISLADMPRLKNVLPQAEGQLSYTFCGEGDSAGRLFLSLAMSARLPVRCQRCMEPFNLPLNSERRFMLCGDDKDADNIPDNCELLDAKDLNLAEFLEEEVLLSLPLAPLHDLSDCPAKQYMAG